MFEIKLIDLDSITVNNRARQVFEDIDKLAQDIRMVGLLNPILITEASILIAGERRLRAFKHLREESNHKQYLQIPCKICKGLTTIDLDLIELIENTGRKDFVWHEEILLKSQIHQRLVNESISRKDVKKWGYRDTAQRLGISLGGLSSDLAMAEELKYFPELKECESKGKARVMAQKMASHLEAFHHMNSMSDEDKQALTGLLSVCEGQGKNVQEGAKQALQTHENSPEGDNPSGTNASLKPATQIIYRSCKWQEIITEIPDSSIGLAELDPPYAMDFSNSQTYANALLQDDWTFDQYETEMRHLFHLLYKKMMPRSWVLVWTCIANALITNEWASEEGFQIQKPGIWRKPSGSCNKPSQVMTSNYEVFLLLSKESALFNTSSLVGCVENQASASSDKSHQWEKPISLYDQLFKAIGKPHSIFFSPFAGSGNCLISAYKAKMKPIGCDKLQKHATNFYSKLSLMEEITNEVQS